MAALADGAIAQRGWSSGQQANEGAGGPGSSVGGAGGESGGSTAAGGRGGATVVGSGRRAGASLGHSGSSGVVAEGDRVRLSALPDPSFRFERPAGLGGDGSSLPGIAGDFPGDGEEPEDDENGPVLELSFDESLEPEKGEAPVVAEGVTFASGEGAVFSNNAQFAIPNAGNLTGEAGTISFTVQGEWAGADETDASFVQLRTPNQWNNRIQITKNGQYLRFVFTDDTGEESGAGIPIRWEPGEQHTVTTTWGEDPGTGQKIAALYVDGRLAGQNVYRGQFIPPTGPMFIGSDHPGGQPGAQGTIRNFTAYNRYMTATEVSGLR
jgi:hypothetical protein